jgi:hypothetical protein
MNKNIYDYFRCIFPIEEEEKMVEKLIKEWRKDKKKIHIYSQEPSEIPIFPVCFPIGVIAGDWPGFGEAVIGTIHEKGWNISHMTGLTQEIEDTQLAIIIAVIQIKNEIELKKFLIDKKEIIENLRRTSIGSVAKRMLLTIESKRLEVYSEAVNIIEKKAKKEYLKDLLGPDGETFKFFASRSKAYISERSPKDLAEQIINNYRIQKDVINSKGEIQIYIKNINTTKEYLTGISIGVFEKDMLLKSIIDSISFVLPDMRISYIKEFTNPDGVLIARIEISDKEGNPYAKSLHTRIINVLKKLHRKARSESGKVLETTGGYEHYLRAIIPHLIKEYNNTKTPQVFFSVMDSSEFCLEFKIIIVSGKKDKVKKATKILEWFDRVDGISLISTHPPKIHGNVVVNIFDVRGDLDKYEGTTNLYDETKKIIRKAIGEFRDFDEGLRKRDTISLQTVLEGLPEVPEKEVKIIYYTLEDFWRLSTSTEDLTKVIKLTYDIYTKHKGNEILLDYIQLDVGTTIVIAFPKSKSLVGKLLNLFKNCEITLSRIEKPNTTILLANVTYKEKPLSKQRLSKILPKLKS